MRKRLLVLSIPLLSTCGTESDDGLNEANARHKWAEQLCKQAQECDCEAGADVEACEETNADFFAQWGNAAQGQYLEFDADCMQSWLDLNAANTCEPLPPSGNDCATVACSFWVGGVPKGEACDIDPAPFATHCAQGLRCFDGTCIDICEGELPKAGEGEMCASQTGGTAALCTEGLFCDFVSSHNCVPIVPLGDPCVAGQCGGGNYCAADDTCTERTPEGDACTENIECETLTCEDQVCVPHEAWACTYLL